MPSSVFYDFHEFSDKASAHSYMVPSAEVFSENMRSCDVRKTDIVVVYDRVGMLSSPRAYWMLKLFGLPNVYILNGTFTKWEAEKRPVETGDTEGAWRRTARKTVAAKDDFTFHIDHDKIRNHDDVHQIAMSNLKNQNKLPIVDSRFVQNFKAGRIPSSLNIPFTQVLNEDKTFKTPEELVKVFKEVGLPDPAN